MQRQIKACTHCRQHKVRCDAAKCYPKSCTRCTKFNLSCIVDQHFKPRKGGQVELLREHLSRIQEQIQSITGSAKLGSDEGFAPPGETNNCVVSAASAAEAAAALVNKAEGNAKRQDSTSSNSQQESLSAEPGKDLSSSSTDASRKNIKVEKPDVLSPIASKPYQNGGSNDQRDAVPNPDGDSDVKEIEASVAERMAAGGRLVPVPGPYVLENINLEENFADTLHNYFMENCAPYVPMFESTSAGELYARSEFSFWTVMVTAALAEPTSHLYVSMVGPVKRLAATKSLLATTRSSSVVQASLVLCTWPLPSAKMLEDMSPRYASLAYSMGLQSGMHRGKFIYEFSRNQSLMPNAVKWRTRTWVQTFITQQMTSASTGIPACMPVDHMIDHALHDEEHPSSPRTSALLKITMFYSKLVAIMGSSVNTQDGLMDPNSRCPTLELLRTDLHTIFPPSQQYEDPVVEIALLYAQTILDSFAFLPDTPTAHQSGFIIEAFQSCTRIVTLTRKLVGNRKIIEFPSFIRNPCSFAALISFRLHLMPQLPEQYVASARESIVTIHHLFRNVPPSWLVSKVDNDVSRIAKILESLNHVLITHPELSQSRRIMRRMRSHLTFSVFYELIYIIHEARRRNAQRSDQESRSSGKVSASEDSKDVSATERNNSINGISNNGLAGVKRPASEMDESSPDSWVSDAPPTGAVHRLIYSEANKRHRELNPLPSFNNISMDTYVASTAVSPNGTTMTKLIPAHADGQPQLPNGNQHADTNEQNSAALVTGSNNSSNDHDKSGFFHTHIMDAQLPPSSLFNGSVAQSSDQKSVQDKNPVHSGAVIAGNHLEHSYDSTVNGQNSQNGRATISVPHNMNDGLDVGADINHLLDGIDWMDTEGDDFLGWMLPRNE